MTNKENKEDTTTEVTIPLKVVLAVMDGAIDVCDMAKQAGGNAEVIDFRQNELIKIKAAFEWYTKEYR